MPNHKKFPYLEITGSNYEVGLAIGKLFKNKIQKTIDERKRTIPKYASLLVKTEEYFNATSKYFPKLIEELKGVSDGAEVNYKDFFFINNREVYDESEIWIAKYGEKVDHCTIAVSFNSEGAVVGHNEDWSLEALEELFVLKATIGDTTFLGLQYANAMPGVSATMNNWGLVQCINDLYQTKAKGVPKNFVARAILECKTLDEAQKLIETTPIASGFNHVLVQGSEVRNIEIAGSESDVMKVVEKPFVHTNHYLSSKLRHLEMFHTKSSEERYNRAKELVKKDMTKKEMMALLSDTKNKKYPICRLDETVGSLVLLPEKGEVWICYDHPCAGEYKKYTL